MSELRVLSPEPGASTSRDWVHRIDVVFVHGLNPLSKANHSENTWTHKSGFMWPRDTLPASLPDARIMLFSYNSHVAWDVSEAGIREHANALLDLTQSRRDEVNSDVPLVFVGHSLGGLVIKQALLHATHNHRVYGKLRACTKALVFFGVPHRGGNGAVIGQILSKSLSLFSGAHRNDLVDNLKKSSKYLAQTSADFAHQLEDYQFLSVIETRGLLRGPIRTVVVESTAATLGLAGHREQVLELDRDHRQICKLENGPDLNRVLRHVKRLAKAALTQPLESEQPTIAAANVESEIIVVPSMNIQTTGTLDFRPHTEFYGCRKPLDDIQTFLDDSNERVLLVHGPAGVGKTSLVLEAVRRNKNRYSVFWFAAQTPHTLQQGFDLASHVIAPELRNVSLPNTHKDLMKWLMSDKAGYWILVFDNVSSRFDALAMLPDELRNGKIIAISQDSDALSSVSDSLLVPELASNDGWALFLSVWESRSHRQRQEIRDLSKLETTIKGLSHRALTVVLAAQCAANMSSGSISESMEDLMDEEASSAGQLDGSIWKWFNLAIELLSPNDIAVLRLLSLFECTYIPTTFLDILKGSRQAAASLGPYAASIRTAIPLSVAKLTQYNLLSQYQDARNSYFRIELAIQDCIQYYQQCDSESTEAILEAGSDLLAASWSTMTGKSSEEQQAIFEVTIPHLRTFCLNLSQCSKKLSGRHADVCLNLTTFMLGKCIEEGSQRCVKQFWQTWTKSENFRVAETNTVEDDGSQFIQPSKIPIWMGSDLDSTLRSPEIVEVVRQGLGKSLGHAFTNGVLVAALGQAWHGVRDDIFAYIHQIGHDIYTTTQLQDICNEVEKGATAGLLSAIRAVLVRDTRFVAEIVDSLGFEIMKEIAYLITKSTPTVLRIVADGIDKTTEESLDFIRVKTFYATTVCFSDLFRGSVSGAICSVIETTMSAETAMGSYERTIAFTAETLSEDILRERTRRVARGFWQVVDGAKTWLAARVTHEILATKRALMHADEGEQIAVNLIDLARHGVMELEAWRTPDWRLSARRAMYWALQAEQARIGWGALDPSVRFEAEYRDQERWNESRIYMDMSSGEWPVC